MEQTQATGGGGRRRWIQRGALAVLLLAAVLFVARLAGAYVHDFVLWVDGLGAIAPVLFVLGYALGTVAFAPGSILTLAAGAVFGIGQGLVLVFLGAVLGSTAAFLVGRYLARGMVERRTQGNPRFQALDRSVGQEGLKLVVLLRLTPIMPYNFLNYALGLTRVRLSHYVIGSLGMLPGTLLYVYSGRLAGDIAAAVGGEAVARGPGYYVVLGLGLVATLILTVMVTRMARRALAQRMDEDEALSADSSGSVGSPPLGDHSPPKPGASSSPEVDLNGHQDPSGMELRRSYDE